MLTESKEVANFLARYLFGKLPKRPVGIFAAQLGNHLLDHLRSNNWDVEEPTNGENERVLRIRWAGEGSTNFVHTAAEEAGLDVVEVMKLLPQNLKIYINPGEVLLQANENGMRVPIWLGSVNADDDYQPIPEHIVRSAAGQAERHSNFGAAGKYAFVGQQQSVPVDDKAVLELISGSYCPLYLEESDESNSTLNLLQTPHYRFIYKPHSSQTFTASEFSQTRFGSSKPRPDLQTILGMKQLAGATNSSNDGSSSSIDPFSAFY